MTAYIIRRILIMFPLLLGVTLVSFIILRSMPGDPALVIAGLGATPENIERIRGDLGLDKPLPTQYLLFVKNLLRGDLGYSFRTRQLVLDELKRRFPFTAILGGTALCLATFFGILFGVLAALKRNSLFDRLITLFLLAGLSTPSFWVGLLLIIIFSVNLGWFPAGGVAGAKSVLLPALSLALHMTAVISRMVRTSLLEVLHENYIRTAKAKGLSPFRIIVRHALRNALIPAVTVIGLQLGFLLGGTIVVELVFNWPGMGQLIVTGILQRDYQMVQGAILFLASCVMVINLFVDILYTYLNPRIQYE